jgi:hypothetical protein
MDRVEAIFRPASGHGPSKCAFVLATVLGTRLADAAAMRGGGVMFGFRYAPWIVVTALLTAACGAAPDDSSSDPSASVGQTDEELNETTNMVYLGSASFLEHCAGGTLGCGVPVSSVPNSHPYFSAPWAHSSCHRWYTFRHGNHCVEAQRLEVSDSHGLIEGNPGLFNALHLPHTETVYGCSGTGGATVHIQSGRHCG